MNRNKRESGKEKKKRKDTERKEKTNDFEARSSIHTQRVNKREERRFRRQKNITAYRERGSRPHLSQTNHPAHMKYPSGFDSLRSLSQRTFRCHCPSRMQYGAIRLGKGRE